MNRCLKPLFYVLFLLVLGVGCKPDDIDHEPVVDVPDEEWILVSPIPSIQGEMEESMPPIISSLYFFDDSTGFVSTGLSLTNAAFNIYFTFDGGRSWERIVPKNEEGKDLIFSKVYARTIHELYLIGSTSEIEHPQEGLYRSVDGGYTWKLIWEKDGVNGAQFPAPKTIVSSFVGDIYLSEDNGATWEEVYNRSETGRHGIGGIKFVSPEIAYAESGIITSPEPWKEEGTGVSYFHKTTDGGYSWQQLQHDDAPLEAVVSWNFINNSTGFGFTYKDKLFKTSDGGLSWQIISDKLPHPYILSSCFLNDKVGYYGTVDGNGMLYKTTDGGISWKRAIPDLKVYVESSREEQSAGIYHLFFTPSGAGYAAGNFGTVWKLQKK